MSYGRYVTDLKEGVNLSKNSAERLLQDAQVLFDRGKYVSSFLLSQLSLEEPAKAFKLIDKHLKGKTFSKKEWEDFALSHDEKIKYIESVIDFWMQAW